MKDNKKDNVTFFSSGAVRDTTVGKSRMELIPVELIPSQIYENMNADVNVVLDKKQMLQNIFDLLIKIRMGNIDAEVLDDLIISSFNIVGKKYIDTMYEVGIHYGAGGEKYGDNNFMLGQKLSHTTGSYLRHLVKYIQGWKDEAPHERGMIWNAINIKLIVTHYKDNPEICDMIHWYKDGKPTGK